MTAAVKYCGGCNPRYDRTGALAELKAALPGVRFVPAAPGQAADALLVLCGCTARCADLTGLEAGMQVIVCGPGDLPGAAAPPGGRIRKGGNRTRVGKTNLRRVGGTSFWGARRCR